MPKLARTAVESSALASVGYDEDLEMLEVEFTSRNVYRYYEVPARVHHELLHAPSKGQFFNTRIRNAFRYSRA